MIEKNAPNLEKSNAENLSKLGRLKKGGLMVFNRLCWIQSA